VSSVIETVAWPSAARERPSNEPRSSTGGRTDTGLDWRSSGIEGKCDRSGRSSVTTSTRTLASTLRGVVSVDHFALDDQIASQAGAVLSSTRGVRLSSPVSGPRYTPARSHATGRLSFRLVASDRLPSRRMSMPCAARSGPPTRSWS
jgi:hypothetical protein